MDLKSHFDIRCKLLYVTRNLSIADKISVIFFISDKPYSGLKMMKILLSVDSKNLENRAFYTWAKKQMTFSCTDWRERLAEVLCILQNYKLVKYLGYDKEEMIEKLASNGPIHASEVKTILYKVCEELNQHHTKGLINCIEKEFRISESNSCSKHRFLEVKILEWSVKKIISTDENLKLNLEPITNYLTSHNFDDLVMKLKAVLENVDFKMLKNIKSIQFEKSIPDCYKITDKSNVGLCVIINEKSFPKSKLNLKPRWGSNKDAERLKEVFTAYGFRVKINTDLTYNKLVYLLNSYAKLIPAEDSIFVLIILSHGSENVIYSSDSVAVSIDAIEMIYQAENCPNLIGKPKIFIVQSCQGLKWQKVLQGSQNESERENLEVNTDAPHESPRREVAVSGPQKGDSIIAWSTVQGYASFRDNYNGSWYIEELTKELWKFGHITDLVDILTLVNNNLRSKTYDGQFMVPSLLSSLSCKIQFPYVEENWLKGRKMMFKRLFFEVYFSEFLRNSKISYMDFLLKVHGINKQ